MAGVPGSGKSWYAKNFLANRENTVYISYNQIKFSFSQENNEYFSKKDTVFNLFISLIKKHLQANENVIADATHLNKKSRMKILNKLDLSKISVHIIFIKAPLNICLNRNSERGGLTKISPETIKKMYKKLTYPNKREQKYYDEIITIYNY